MSLEEVRLKYADVQNGYVSIAVVLAGSGNSKLQIIEDLKNATTADMPQNNLFLIGFLYCSWPESITALLKVYLLYRYQHVGSIKSGKQSYTGLYNGQK